MPEQDIREHAHKLINYLPANQVSAMVGMLESMMSPLERTLANAPIDDEPAGSRIASTPEAECTSHEDFLAELGFTQEEIDNASEPASPATRHA